MKENKNMKNILILILILIIVVLSICLILALNKNNSDNNKEKLNFSDEYTQVGEDNIFVYKNYDEVIDFLSKGTGVILFGFPECKWCQRYVVYLNKAAKEMGFDEIYYYNIKEDRTNNTDKYQKIITFLSNYLHEDEEGNKRIYVPSVVFVNAGEIVGFDDETAWDTKGEDDPNNYWTVERIDALNDRLNKYLIDSNPNMCSKCDE